MLNTLTKAVFPVAGLGTRFLPATKAIPKEMLPMIDKPLIQYAVEEAISAGFKDLIFITNDSKAAIADHFSKNLELENKLTKNEQLSSLLLARNILPAHVRITYIDQPQPRGLGDAVLRAKSIIDDQPFAVILPDDLIICDDRHKNCLQQMVDLYQEKRSSIIAVEPIDSAHIHKYGVIDISARDRDHLFIQGIVEKPLARDAPSNLAVVGRYIFSPEIFSFLEKTAPSTKNEIQLTDAISDLLKEHCAYGLKFIGDRYDCGDKLGYIKAIVSCALKRREFSADFKDYLMRLYKKMSGI